LLGQALATGEAAEGDPCPECTANIVSYITFSWIGPLLSKGYKCGSPSLPEPHLLGFRMLLFVNVSLHPKTSRMGDKSVFCCHLCLRDLAACFLPLPRPSCPHVCVRACLRACVCVRVRVRVRCVCAARLCASVWKCVRVYHWAPVQSPVLMQPYHTARQ
jgi:hypothetical protein